MYGKLSNSTNFINTDSYQVISKLKFITQKFASFSGLLIWVHLRITNYINVYIRLKMKHTLKHFCVGIKAQLDKMSLLRNMD